MSFESNRTESKPDFLDIREFMRGAEESLGLLGINDMSTSEKWHLGRIAEDVISKYIKYEKTASTEYSRDFNQSVVWQEICDRFLSEVVGFDPKVPENNGMHLEIIKQNIRFLREQAHNPGLK